MRSYWFALLSIACARGGSGTPEPTANPVGVNLEVTAGCDREELDFEWASNQYGPVQVGDNVCIALGRWGPPSNLSTSESDYGSTLTLQWSTAMNPDFPHTLTVGSWKSKSSEHYRISSVGRH